MEDGKSLPLIINIRNNTHNEQDKRNTERSLKASGEGTRNERRFTTD